MSRAPTVPSEPSASLIRTRMVRVKMRGYLAHDARPQGVAGSFCNEEQVSLRPQLDRAEAQRRRVLAS